jgi:hypothetical protein
MSVEFEKQQSGQNGDGNTMKNSITLADSLSNHSEGKIFRPRSDHTVVARSGSYIKAAALIMTTTTLPTLLALPSALAYLGWVGGLFVLFIASLGAFYCLHRLVQLNDFNNGPHLTFPKLGQAITGKKWVYFLIQSLQFAVQWGVGVTNTITAAQFMDEMYTYKNPTGGSGDWTQTKFTLLTTAVIILLAFLPDISQRNLFILASGSFTLCYSGIAIGLAFGNNNHANADFSILGSTSGRVFNAFNAIGMMWFVYGDTVYPELQSFLMPDIKATLSTVKTMRKGMYIAFSVTLPLLLVVAVSGYWAFGNTVAPLLLDWEMTPRWLTTIAVVTSIAQLIFSIQVYAQPIYDAAELTIMKHWPNANWSQHLRKVKGRSRSSSSKKKYDVVVVDYEGGKGSSSGRQNVYIPSIWLMLITRTLYSLSVGFIAIIFPFFSSIMGLVGAVGLTPLTYLIPLTLWIMSGGGKGGELGKMNKYLHIGLAVMFATGGMLATIGSIRSIIVSFDTFSLG